MTKWIAAIVVLVSPLCGLAQNGQQTADPWAAPSKYFPSLTVREQYKICNSVVGRRTPWELDSRCPNYIPNRPPPPKSMVTCDRDGNSVTCIEH